MKVNLVSNDLCQDGGTDEMGFVIDSSQVGDSSQVESVSHCFPRISEEENYVLRDISKQISFL